MDGESGSSVRELHGRASSKKTNQEKSTNLKSPTASNWNNGKWLMEKSMEDLESMPITDKMYTKVIEGNIKQIGDRMKSMKLGDRNVEVTKYPTKADAHLLKNVIREYDQKYDESILEKKKQIKMKIIDQMLRFPKHTKISDYSLEFNMCGEIGCELCPVILRVLQMHDEEVTKEVIGFCPLPRLDVDGKTFLPINECQRLMDNGSSLADELKYLRKLRGEFKENGDELAERKKLWKPRQADELVKCEKSAEV